LDSSLIAAFISEFDSGTPTTRQLRTLRKQLSKLAIAAERQLINEAPSPSSSAAEGTNHTFSAPCTLTDATSPLASPRSTFSAASFSTPLGFLQAAFPGVPSTRLEDAITNAGFDGCTEDVDMGRAIQLLLAQEYSPNDEESGLMPTSRPEQRTVKGKRKKRKDKIKVITINSIRPLQQNVPKSPSYVPQSQNSSGVDIWTSISSISTQLATLLPSRPESFFKSFFHSPESSSPAAAVRRALAAIINAEDNDGSLLDMVTLLRLQEIIQSTDEYSKLDAEGQQRFLSDTRLCLRAVGSRQDDAFDLVLLLRSLPDDAAECPTSPHHQGPSPYSPHGDDHSFEMSKRTPLPVSPHTELLPGPRSVPASPQLQGEWNVVSRQKRSASTSHKAPRNHASTDLPGTSTHQIGLANDTEIARLKQRVDDLKTCLAEASESAGKAWKGGRSKNLERQYHIEEVRILLGAVWSVELSIT
jgi:hypothetical protein